jgi:hypothetical protein
VVVGVSRQVHVKFTKKFAITKFKSDRELNLFLTVIQSITSAVSGFA